jgi:hypothetical protein
VCLTRPPLTSTASRRHRRGAVIVPNAALYPRDDDADGKKDGNKRAKRRTWGQAIGVLAVPLGIHALITPDAAHAAGGWYNDVQLGPRSDGGFIGGGAAGGAGDATPAFGYEDRGDDYDYGEFILIRVWAIGVTPCFLIFFYRCRGGRVHSPRGRSCGPRRPVQVQAVQLPPQRADQVSRFSVQGSGGWAFREL